MMDEAAGAAPSDDDELEEKLAGMHEPQQLLDHGVAEACIGHDG